MANGETRAAIKKGAQGVAKGLEKMTLGIGKGLKDFTTGTVDAILKPQTIPDKIEHAFDVMAVQPTRKTIHFFEESTQSLMEETDNAFKRRIKEAQQGAHRLKVVFATPLKEIGGSYVPVHHPKSDADIKLIEETLKGNFVFAHLPDAKRESLIGAFEPVRFKKGSQIIKQGDVGDYFYVIGKGEVYFQVDGEDVGTAIPGQAFGELALLYQAPRAATCVAKTDCGLFRLDQECFRRILAQQIKDQDATIISTLKKVPYFEKLDDEYLSRIACNLQIEVYHEGETLVRRGDELKKFFIIKEGHVELTEIESGGADYSEMKFGPGQFFGDAAIVDDRPALGTLTAVGGPVVALSLNRLVFIRILGDDLESLITKTLDKKKLAHIPFGKRKGPADNELDLLASAVVNKKFRKGHVFFTEGQRCIPALYLMRSGQVTIRSSTVPKLEDLLGFSVGTGDVKTIGYNGYFGNDTLGNNDKGEFGVARYTVVATDDVEAGVLDLDAIRSVVVTSDSAKSKIKMEDLDMIRILGAGTFGKVWLVQRKGTNEAYALKVQVKKQLIEYNQADGVIREKNVMAKLDHPFIIKMVSSYKDDDKLYMLLKLYQGGELQTIIHTDNRDGLPEWAARFYAANILEGLSYMHRRHILYRDLKPENVLLDSDGYTVIVDLGFAKVVKEKTYTFCGTPLYLAPEIIMQKGHDKGADHWSWGVMVYEMIVGMTPFYDGIVDQMGLFKNIVRGKVEHPKEMHALVKDLISRMLTVNPAERLGSFAGADKDIRRHPFFDDIDWKRLLRKELKVPFKPDVKNPLDGSNFDDYSKLEAKERNERYPKLTGAEQRLFDKF
mmetsp:Transcript_10375/g.21429  ORF Transcript_10375/g.21429 Transcript_10375/m.21429 type:complete len:837 (+) Transcript_10375:96-2606(+)